MAGEQPLDGQNHSRRTEAALQAVLIPKSLLDGVELAVRGEAFDDGEAVAIGLDGQQRTRLHGSTVEHHGAGAADGGFAADVGSGETGDIAQIVDEQQPGLDFGGVGLAVDGERDFVCDTRSTTESTTENTTETYQNRGWKQRGAGMWRCGAG